LVRNPIEAGNRAFDLVGDVGHGFRALPRSA
jgi:hypothetical protein